MVSSVSSRENPSGMRRLGEGRKSQRPERNLPGEFVRHGAGSFCQSWRIPVDSRMLKEEMRVAHSAIGKEDKEAALSHAAGDDASCSRTRKSRVSHNWPQRMGEVLGRMKYAACLSDIHKP